MRFLGPLAACLVLASCTATTEPDPPAPSSETTRAPTPEPPDEPAPEPVVEEPLVLAVHATRSVSDVPVAAARRMLARGARSWTAIGQEGEAMRVVSGGLPTGVAPGATALDHASIALDRVRTSSDAVAVVPASEVDATVRVLTVGGVHPLRSPDDYPVQVATGGEPGTVVTMTVVGDIMLGRGVGDVLDEAGAPAAALRPLAERLASADITVGNLESTLSDNGSPTQGTDSFAADPAVRRGLRLAGFDALSLANNHLGDFGPVALDETLDLLRDGRFEWFGGGRNLDRARRPLVIEIDGVSTGFYGTESIGETPAATATTGGTNRLNMPPRTGPLGRATLRRMAKDLRRLATQVDTVVVVPHWGTQYTHVPEPIQRRVARVFARAGADLVLGGHPHWVQGWEQMDDTTVVHSLGNFVFDMDFSTQTMEGVFVEIVTWDGELKAVEPMPYLMDDDFTPRLAPGPSGQSVLDDMWSTSTGPYVVP